MTDRDAAGWDDLARELDAWATDGRTAEFWWRDDDAADATPALDRLLDLRDALGVPLGLAVIPATARPPLAAALGAQDAIAPMQHGYAHANHRPPDAKKAELGADRESWDIARELAAGRGRMIDLFGDDGWLDVMVPPWNRIDPPVTALLPGLGYRGLSAFGPRRTEGAPEALHIVNTHVDIIDWHGARRFAGEVACLSAAVRHLRAKRGGTVDDAEPTGLLTHHLAHDDDCWAFTERFVRTTAAHCGACWCAPDDLFPEPA